MCSTNIHSLNHNEHVHWITALSHPNYTFVTFIVIKNLSEGFRLFAVLIGNCFVMTSVCGRFVPFYYDVRMRTFCGVFL